MTLRAALFAALLTCVGPVTAAAQELSLMAGKAEYDLSGVHTSNVWAVRGADAVRSFLIVEASLSYIHTRQDLGRTDLWLPEVQLQARTRWGAFAPYLGAGVGAAIDNPEEDAIGAFELETDLDLTTSVAVGLRVAIADRLGLRLDGRLHGVEVDWVGTVAGVTAGVTIGL